jgi:hypothetical protein
LKGINYSVMWKIQIIIKVVCDNIHTWYSHKQIAKGYDLVGHYANEIPVPHLVMWRNNFQQNRTAQWDLREATFKFIQIYCLLNCNNSV